MEEIIFEIEVSKSYFDYHGVSCPQFDVSIPNSIHAITIYPTKSNPKYSDYFQIAIVFGKLKAARLVKLSNGKFEIRSAETGNSSRIEVVPLDADNVLRDYINKSISQKQNSKN